MRMKFFPLIAVLSVVSLVFCSADESAKPRLTPSALLVDGFCVQNRSARSPAAYYASDAGRAQVKKFLEKAEDEAPMLQLGAEGIAKIREIAFSDDNKVESGKMNFFVRFFDDRGEIGSRALSREKLKEIIDSLPQAARAGLVGMYKNG
jgi:hypothetical protein